MTVVAELPSFAADKRANWLLPMLLCLLGVSFLHARQLDRKGYWEDEIYTARDIGIDRISDRTSRFRLSFSSLTYRNDNHPPLYFWLISKWTAVFGYSEVASRTFSLLFFVLSLLVCGLACREWAPDWRWGPSWTVLVVGVSPAFAVSAREARMYSLVLFWVSVSLLFFCRAWRSVRAGRKPNWGDLAALAVANSLGLYTHYYFVWLWLSEITLVSWALIRHGRRGASPTLRVIASLLAAALLFAPWIPMLRRQYQIKVRPGLWVFGPDSWGFYLSKLLQALGKLAWDLSAADAGWKAALVVGAVLVLLLSRRRAIAATGASVLAALGGLAVLYALANDLVHHTLTLGTSRYMFSCLLPLVLALVCGLAGVGGVARTVGMVGLLLVNLLAWRAQTTRVNHPDWRVIADRIEERRGLPTVVSDSNYRRCLRFYLPRDHRVVTDGESSVLPREFYYLAMYVKWNGEDRARVEELRQQYQTVDSVEVDQDAELIHLLAPESSAVDQGNRP